jgi:hypothetical protein
MREPAPDVVAQARGLLDQCTQVRWALPGEHFRRQVLEPLGLPCPLPRPRPLFRNFS